MELIVYPLLSAKSKKAIARAKKQFGRPYDYTPRRNLVYRLSVELGLSLEQVRLQIMDERAFILKNSQYY